ncbi:MAG: hypothetical protein WCJ35_23055 [Planctomycetota bacterium]
MWKRLWNEDEGVLTFEWILLLTLLVIGVIGGVAGIRDAIIHEAQGVLGAMVSTDQMYRVQPPLGVGVRALFNVSGGSCTSSAVGSRCNDQAEFGGGRLSNTDLTGMNQTINSTLDLCPVK